MAKQYSIAQARKNLADVVDEARAGADIQLTRRGRPVAVVIAVEEYDRLTTGRRSFADAYREFRTAFPEGRTGVSPRYVRSLRDRNRGRPVKL